MISTKQNIKLQFVYDDTHKSPFVYKSKELLSITIISPSLKNYTPQHTNGEQEHEQAGCSSTTG